VTAEHAVPDVVLDGGMPAVAGCEESGGTATGARGAGEEHLMAQALALAGQGLLGSGMRPLAAQR